MQTDLESSSDGSGAVTIADVAARAGVSKTTVSHVLSGRRPVSEATRLKVQRVIDELGFQQNFFALGLSGQRTRTVALLVQDLTNPFYPAVARGLQQSVGRAGYVVLLGDAGAEVPPVEAFLSEAVQRRVDGVVVAAVNVPDAKLAPLTAADIPVVTIGTPRHGTFTDVVSANDERIAADAVAYLPGRGHRRIATITGPTRTAPGSTRLSGYREALREAGLPAARSLEAVGDWTRDGGAKAMAQLLDADEPPTAVFCANDMMAVGAMSTLRSRGIDVPGQVALVGVDDIDSAALVHPALSTVAIPAQEIGRVAGDQLLTRMDGDRGPGRHTLVQHQLVIRESA